MERSAIAQILIKSKGRIVHPESSSFDRLTTAKALLKRREKELATPGGLYAARRKSGSVGDVIDDYLKSTNGDIGRTKGQVLRKIRDDFAISDIPCDELRAMNLQPHRKGKIFPYNSDTISARFTRACKFLEIEDRHFHDLHHEAVSRLFEMGKAIPQAAAVSGHRKLAVTAAIHPSTKNGG